MTESMIEKAALAVRRHRFEKAGLLHEYREDIPLSQDLLDEVGVMIEAMKEPTKRMIAAGDESIRYGAHWTHDGVDIVIDTTRTTWEDMIDAALIWPAGSADRAGVPLARD